MTNNSGVKETPKDCYVIYKRAVYGHGVFGIYFDYKEAKASCKEAAAGDEDNYHRYEVFRVPSGVRYIGTTHMNGFMSGKPLFSCRKWEEGCNA